MEVDEKDTHSFRGQEIYTHENGYHYARDLTVFVLNGRILNRSVCDVRIMTLSDNVVSNSLFIPTTILYSYNPEEIEEEDISRVYTYTYDGEEIGQYQRDRILQEISEMPQALKLIDPRAWVREMGK